MFQNRSIQFDARARDADGYLGTKFTPFQTGRDQRRSERKWEKQICCLAACSSILAPVVRVQWISFLKAFYIDTVKFCLNPAMILDGHLYVLT